MRAYKKEGFPLAKIRRFLEPGPIVLISSAHRGERNIMTLGWNSHGPDVDKFEEFGLTAVDATKVGAPLIAECYANFECKLIDTSLIKGYGLFVFDVVKAHVATSPRYPTTVHYRGDGVFMVSGRNVSYRRRFKPENL